MTTLHKLAARHCEASKPPMSFKDFVHEAYGVSHRHFRNIATGRYGATRYFLRRLNRCHLRLFPGESATLRLPKQPPVLVGPKPANAQPDIIPCDP